MLSPPQSASSSRGEGERLFQEEAEIEKSLLMTLSSRRPGGRIWAIGERECPEMCKAKWGEFPVSKG